MARDLVSHAPVNNVALARESSSPWGLVFIFPVDINRMVTQFTTRECRVMEPPVRDPVPAVSETLVVIFKSHTIRDSTSQQGR
jgi:hypothetical protein